MKLESIIKGYTEMGKINLKLSEEYFHLENEGASYIDGLDENKSCKKREKE